MKRLLYLMLVMAMLVSLVACDNTPSNDTGIDDTEESTNTTDTTDSNETNINADQPSSLGLAYEVNEDGSTCTIIGMGSYSDEKLYLPTQIDGYNVTAIKEGAFNKTLFLTEVTIPDSIVDIEGVIFDGCKNLKKVVCYASFENGLPFYVQHDYDLGFKIVETIVYGAETLPERFFFDTPRITNLILTENVKNIGEWVFASADGVDNLTIPGSVTNIAPKALAGVKANSIQLSKDNTVYKCENNCLINKETGELIIGTKNSEIPSDGSVTRIGDYAFAGLEIETMTIPNTVTSIGAMAFGGCVNLEEIIIPSSVTSIGENAFYFCKHLIITTPTDSYAAEYAEANGITLNLI